MALFHSGFSLLHLLILDKCICALDLYSDQPAILLEVPLQVSLPRVFHIEIDDKQRTGRLDVSPPRVLAPLYIPVTLLKCPAQELSAGSHMLKRQYVLWRAQLSMGL